MPNIKSAIRVFLETLLSAFLFCFQTVLNVGTGVFTMAVPLFPYALYFISNPKLISVAWSEFLEFFFWGRFVVARIIVYIGLIVLFVSAATWIWYHFKHFGLFRKGIYGKVRHPQFLGIITISLGLTVMALTFGIYGRIIPGADLMGGPVFAVGMWFIQVLGYLALAKFEEQRLTKKFGQEYLDYKQKTPMLFPIKNRTKISEVKFTLVILIVICIILLLVPFTQINYPYAQSEWPI
jgi:protein-S-isoprenylcysteine O-methyltransferase Ste14